MKKNIFWISVIIICMITNIVIAQENKTYAANPLKEEMMLLDAAYKNLIDSLVLNNLSAIEGPVEEMLKAKEKTETALEKGEIKLPKNNDKIKTFKDMDEEFHLKLKNLIVLSKKGDKNGIQKLTHELLNGCIQCHDNFRQ
jgi:hypothetical protein